MSKKGKSLEQLKSGEIREEDTRIVRDIAPRNLKGVKEIRAEMARVYRMIFDNKIVPSDATKLIFILDKMVQAIKSEAEMAQIANAYMDAWSGITITPPAGERELPAPAPHAAIIAPEKSEDKNDE